MKIGLITCSKEKVSYRCAASELYSASPDFRANLEFGLNNYDELFVISGKFGLLGMDTVADPYDVWIGAWSLDDQFVWGCNIVSSLISLGYVDAELVLHTDDMYAAAIQKALAYFKVAPATHIHYRTHN